MTTAFSNYSLHRDVELAVVGARGLGNGWVLPAGPLREPPSRLDEVDAIVLNATEDVVTSSTPRYVGDKRIHQCNQLRYRRDRLLGYAFENAV